MEINKSKVLDWLSAMVNHTFNHHFSDKWINVNIWNNDLTISFDSRQENQVELFNKLPDNIKGCIQRNTNKRVNEKTLYFKVSEICNIIYPDIVSNKLIKKTKHQSGSGGWIDVGEYFYTYDWEVLLSDNTTINYNNQEPKMDMIKGDYSFNRRIQEREFKKLINLLTINCQVVKYVTKDEKIRFKITKSSSSY